MDFQFLFLQTSDFHQHSRFSDREHSIPILFCFSFVLNFVGLMRRLNLSSGGRKLSAVDQGSKIRASTWTQAGRSATPRCDTSSPRGRGSAPPPFLLLLQPLSPPLTLSANLRAMTLTAGTKSALCRQQSRDRRSDFMRSSMGHFPSTRGKGSGYF